MDRSQVKSSSSLVVPVVVVVVNFVIIIITSSKIRNHHHRDLLGNQVVLPDARGPLEVLVGLSWQDLVGILVIAKKIGGRVRLLHGRL